MTPEPAPEAAPKSSLPTWALLFSLVGIFCFPLLLVGLVLGGIALTQKKGSRTMALASMSVAVAGAWLVAFVFWPNFRRFGARSKQSECRSYLRQAYTRERYALQETKSYSVNPKRIEFAPEGWLRYTYFFSAQGPVAKSVAALGDDDVGVASSPAVGTGKTALTVDQARAAIPPALAQDLGVHGTCPDGCWVTVACVGEIDGDPGADIWSVSTRDRKSPSGEVIPAGDPFHEVDDLDD